MTTVFSSEQNPYVGVTILAPPDSDILRALILDFSPAGVWENDAEWVVYFHSSSWTDDLETEFADAVKKSFADLVLCVEPIPKTNWNEEWEKSITPVRAGARFFIAPSWHADPPPEGMIVLIIDPKMSFGTGFHQTTRIMLKMLETAVHKADRVLDLGTGTGILAIAAVKLGAEHALGVDIDEWSFENGIENVDRNGLRGQVEIRIGTIDVADGTYDVIASNITRNDNIQLLPEFVKRLRPGGRLLLSGMLVQDREAMEQACSENGFAVQNAESEDEWLGLTVSLNA